MSTEDFLPAEGWIREYALKLGVEPPSEAQIAQLLELAGIAAHASERQAAPISTWLAAHAGLGPEQALAAAKDLAAELG